MVIRTSATTQVLQMMTIFIMEAAITPMATTILSIMSHMREIQLYTNQNIWGIVG